MYPFKLTQKLTALLLMILALTGCGGFGGKMPTIEQVQEAATPTPAVLADCFQSATALAWLDGDGDGVWDEAEQPLQGIEFVLEPTVYSRTKSDATGTAKIFATTPGGNCAQQLQVMVVNFRGYKPTTPPVVDYTSSDKQYAFGFQPISKNNTLDIDAN